MDASSPSPSPRTETPPFAAWTPYAQQALVGVLILAVGILIGFLLRGDSPREREARPRVDLNRAEVKDLRTLPGVGAGVAQRIKDYRDEHGDFERVDDLRHVAGVGPKMVEQVRPWLQVAPPEATSAPRMPIKAGPPAGLIDVNSADVTQLQQLPGIGPKLSQRIVDERTLRGRFNSVDDLRRVAGIGAKTLEKLRPLIVTPPPAPGVPTAAAGVQ
jgi:competence protein ComEA